MISSARPCAPGGDYTAVVVRSTTIGVDYLDKYGSRSPRHWFGGVDVEPTAKQHPKMFWRSKPTNPVNKWYLSRADGMHRDGEWLVFWYGLENHEEINACIAEALGQEATFHEDGARPCLSRSDW